MSGANEPKTDAKAIEDAVHDLKAVNPKCAKVFTHFRILEITERLMTRRYKGFDWGARHREIFEAEKHRAFDATFFLIQRKLEVVLAVTAINIVCCFYFILSLKKIESIWSDALHAPAAIAASSLALLTAAVILFLLWCIAALWQSRSLNAQSIMAMNEEPCPAAPVPPKLESDFAKFAKSVNSYSMEVESYRDRVSLWLKMASCRRRMLQTKGATLPDLPDPPETVAMEPISSLGSLTPRQRKTIVTAYNKRLASRLEAYERLAAEWFWAISQPVTIEPTFVSKQIGRVEHKYVDSCIHWRCESIRRDVLRRRVLTIVAICFSAVIGAWLCVATAYYFNNIIFSVSLSVWVAVLIAQGYRVFSMQSWYVNQEKVLDLERQMRDGVH